MQIMFDADQTGVCPLYSDRNNPYVVFFLPISMLL